MATASSYPHRIPSDLDRLRAIPPQDRATFDAWQRTRFLAHSVRVGDWLMYRDRREYGHRGGAVEVILHDEAGLPVFGISGFAVETFRLVTPGGTNWFLLPGDEVEYAEGDEWRRGTVSRIEGARQCPRFRVSGSRRVFMADQLRTPAGEALALAR